MHDASSLRQIILCMLSDLRIMSFIPSNQRFSKAIKGNITHFVSAGWIHRFPKGQILLLNLELFRSDNVRLSKMILLQISGTATNEKLILTVL